MVQNVSVAGIGAQVRAVGEASRGMDQAAKDAADKAASATQGNGAARNAPEAGDRTPAAERPRG